ncbi:MAG: hypothetical protein JSS82_18360 [Bacteroidetes bacterium]|nr:hypothetical protein [Bacteroidota bacterium]
MAKRILHITVAFWLSVLLLFGSTTMSFVHLFAGHEDTVESQKHQDGPAIESQHHHCAFLGFAVAPFANDSQSQYFVFSKQEHVITYRPVYNATKLQTCAGQFLLRGPPAVA